MTSKNSEMMRFNGEVQKEVSKIAAKQAARTTALNQSPTTKINDQGMQVTLTASEIVKEAQIIYDWLIKDL